MRVNTKNGIRIVCNDCGFVSQSEQDFNIDDTKDGKDFCRKCRPQRMSYMQLIEWLAKGNGFLCQQAMEYCVAPTFSLSPVRINGRDYPGKSDDQIPYNEHELVVSRFSDGFCNWQVPTLEMYKRDCKGGK